MNEKQWKDAFDSIKPDQGQSERIWARLMESEDAVSPEKQIVAKPKPGKHKLWRTALLAAVIAGLMGASAYALGLFGREALEIREPEITPQKIEIGEDGYGHLVDNPEEGGYFSITQPQELPEDMDPAVREKVENSRTAWEEWLAWREENDAHVPAAFEAPEGSFKSDLRDNGDGTWTLTFSRPDKTDEELTAITREIEETLHEDREKGFALQAEYDAYFSDPANWVILEERIVTGAEVEQYHEATQSSGMLLEDYDPNYRVENAEQARALEEIAAKYGLTLRKDRQTLFGRGSDYYAVHGKPDWMSDEMYREELQNTEGETAEAMLTALSEACCRGDLFLTPPPFVDHLYWYQEGSFGVNYSWVTQSGKIAECYLYNSCYATLSSGWELFDEIEDVSAYTARSYQTKDGAEVTLLESEHQNAWGWYDDSYVFVYLEDSFLVLKVNLPEGITGAELEAIADSVQYSQINR